ncbi:MAG: MCP four helix bundle domain-containing protein, partial [Gemmatimonadota bacterium]
MRWFDNLALSRKLMLGFGTVTILLVGTGALALQSLARLDRADTELYEKQTVRLGQVGEWSTMMERYQTRLRDYALATSEADRQRVSGELAELSARANELQDAYETQIDSDADRRAFETLLAARQRYLEPAGRVVELVDQGLQEDAMALLGGDAGQAGAAYSESLDVIADSRLEAAGETEEVPEPGDAQRRGRKRDGRSHRAERGELRRRRHRAGRGR